MSTSPERLMFHELAIPRLKTYMRDNDVIYDIGKSMSWDYKTFFTQKLLTIDRNPEVKPDVLLDIENDKIETKCDVVLCNGVMEQCTNPFKLVDGVHYMLNREGVALFGIMSVAYPIFDCDYVRFTPRGIERLLNRFELLADFHCFRGDVVSYVYVICRKK